MYRKKQDRGEVRYVAVSKENPQTLKEQKDEGAKELKSSEKPTYVKQTAASEQKLVNLITFTIVSRIGMRKLQKVWSIMSLTSIMRKIAPLNNTGLTALILKQGKSPESQKSTKIRKHRRSINKLRKWEKLSIDKLKLRAKIQVNLF